jgi:hypothetical protein
MVEAIEEKEKKENGELEKAEGQKENEQVREKEKV